MTRNLLRIAQTAVLAGALAAAACTPKPPADRVRVSGQVEATDVRVSAKVGGRLLDLHVAEGDRVKAGDLVARLDTTDAALILARAGADRAQAEAQLALALAGARPEDIRQAEAQVASAESTVASTAADLTAAEADASRFETLLAQNSGSRKQRDDAVARRDGVQARRRGAEDQVRAAREHLARLRAGSRREEIAAARARLAAADAQMAIGRQAIADAVVVAPVGGVVSEKVADVGELLQPHAPIVVITDLDHAWANVYLDEPLIPRVRVGQTATIFTDAGGPGIAGTVSTVAEKAEFTPRNAQTADERMKLVYRLKIAVDNRSGVLKSGMPIEAEIPFAR